MATETDSKARDSYHHGDLRGALIRATATLIEEKGIDQFSVSDACRVAGVSTAAPYKHFKNKDEMINGAILAAMQRHGQELQDDLAPHAKGTIDRIVAMGLNYITFAVREPQMFRLRFAQFKGEPDPDVRDSGKAIYGMVQEEVRAALGEDTITEKVRERAYMLWSVVHGMSYLAMVPEFADKRPDASQKAFLRDIAQRVLRN